MHSVLVVGATHAWVQVQVHTNSSQKAAEKVELIRVRLPSFLLTMCLLYIMKQREGPVGLNSEEPVSLSYFYVAGCLPTLDNKQTK